MYMEIGRVEVPPANRILPMKPEPPTPTKPQMTSLDRCKKTG